MKAKQLGDWVKSPGASVLEVSSVWEVNKSTMGPTLGPKECQARLLTSCPEMRERVSKKPKD